METSQKLIQEAHKSLGVADHLVYTTYPLVHDAKLLLKISENIYTAMILAIDAVLAYDYYFKRIEFHPERFDGKLDIFKSESEPRYGFGRAYIFTLLELRELIAHHQRSPIAFLKHDKYLMFSPDYSVMKGISIEKVKSYLHEAKIFIEKANRIIST